MSFMFKPCKYDDPTAVNHIQLTREITNDIAIGTINVTNKIVESTMPIIKQNGRCILAVDGYISADFTVFCNLLCQSAGLAGLEVTMVSTEQLYRSADELENMLLKYLPQNREIDPVLLFGKLYDGGYDGLFDVDKKQNILNQMDDFACNGSGIFVLYGYGSLEQSFQNLVDIKCWIDITPKYAAIRVKDGFYKNIGDVKARPFKETMRRCYYVDFECATKLRGQLIKQNMLDWYIEGDHPENMVLLKAKIMNTIFSKLAERPFRCKPVYLEGIWGGTYIKRIRNLPENIRNCAWSFDMIPMEVSIVAEANGIQLEFPFFTFVQAKGAQLMGQTCVDKFGGYFPIRFNYDDTWHSSGNMSIQVHPDEKYVKQNNNELGRQDESYYVVEAAQDAKTYLGFKDDADVDDFIQEVQSSENHGTRVDFERYINAVPSKPGLQLMIPAGTIHSSGRNQLVLEIGSLTIGSYTYKMYDYLRIDFDGNRRPIHSKHGANVLRRERRSRWVSQNLVQSPNKIIRSGEGFFEKIIGEHDLLYFSLRTVTFDQEYQDDTSGRFHVLSLVNGEHVRIQSNTDSTCFYDMNYLDIVVVPAQLGSYRVQNLGNQPVTLHKTLLKDGFENQ